MLQIPLAQFQEARQVLGQSLETPLIRLMAPEHSQPIYLKTENLQPGGSFKIRGATYCISRLPKSIKRVVAYSTGNHAQAVALAARQRNLEPLIVMSPEAKESKVKATERFGGKVIMVPASERKKHAEALAQEPGSYLVPPYDHEYIITGQGTIGLKFWIKLIP
jgi:threonine dehydratase